MGLEGSKKKSNLRKNGKITDSKEKYWERTVERNPAMIKKFEVADQEQKKKPKMQKKKNQNVNAQHVKKRFL